MGLGKTIQTIALLVYLMEYKDNHGPHVIIAPKVGQLIHCCGCWILIEVVQMSVREQCFYSHVKFRYLHFLQAILHNWMREFEKWAPSTKVIVYDGVSDERKILRERIREPKSFNVVVTHYDLVVRDKALFKKVRLWRL